MMPRQAGQVPRQGGRQGTPASPRCCSAAAASARWRFAGPWCWGCRTGWQRWRPRSLCLGLRGPHAVRVCNGAALNRACCAPIEPGRACNRGRSAAGGNHTCVERRHLQGLLLRQVQPRRLGQGRPCAGAGDFAEGGLQSGWVAPEGQVCRKCQLCRTCEDGFFS